MKLPNDVLAARERMEKADAALHADIESNAPADKIRHIRLLDELQLATDDYIEKITAAVVRRSKPVATETLQRITPDASVN
jgi:hypothetical protein